MRKVEHRLRLDLLRGGNQGYIRVKRGENGARRLAIALYMHSVPYMADAGTTAVFRAIKPDNTKLFNSATITDNVVTVELTTQTVAALGTVRCELSIYGTNNELLYSPQFDIIVEDYLYSDTAIESTSEYTDLTEAISKVNNIISTEADRVAAENQRVANETARVSAETERASAETARAEAETARATAETERASAETTRASAESSRAFSENVRKQAEKQRVSSETQRNNAEAGRSTAESDRRSAETARVQEFNAIKADAQDAATAEAARATNEAARVAAETNRANAEQLRVALYNQWNNATASAYDSLSPSVTLSNKDGHKHFNFGIPSNAVTYTPQTLTDEQQTQARTNIGAGQPVFVVNITEGVDEDGRNTYTADKTAAEIEAAYQAGRTIVCKTQAQFLIGFMPVELPLVSRNQERVFIFAVDQLVGDGIFAITVNISDSGVEVSNNMVEAYERPIGGIPKSDLAQSVQTSLAKADTAISLGLTAATPGQIIKVKTVQDGKPTEWEAVDGEVPSVTASDNGKFLRVVSGAWTAVEIANANGGSF